MVELIRGFNLINDNVGLSSFRGKFLRKSSKHGIPLKGILWDKSQKRRELKSDVE